MVFDNTKKHENADTIVPDLAEGWSWNAEKTKLTFKLRQGVKWHDGKPFTAKDVQCTWHMLTGKTSNEDFRQNPRAIWWQNLSEVALNGDYRRPRPRAAAGFPAAAGLGIFAGLLVHVAQRDMRTKPVGTGPFKFVEYKRGESIRLIEIAHYFKKGLPYLDAIDFKIVENRSTRMLAFPGRRFRHDFPD